MMAVRGVLGAALLLAVGAGTAWSQQVEPVVGATAPVIVVSDMEGREVILDARKSGKGMVIEFWATWCEVCDRLLPSVRVAHQRFSDRFDFYGVNVTVNESKSRVQRWLDREKPPYRTLYDERGVAARAFRAPATSYVVVVDAGGVIRYTGSGADQDLARVLGTIGGDR